MDVIRFERPFWFLFRSTLGDRGQIEDSEELGAFWNRRRAEAERERLSALNTDQGVAFEVIEATSSGAYPADGVPPWETDPDRLGRRMGRTTAIEPATFA